MIQISWEAAKTLRQLGLTRLDELKESFDVDVHEI